MKILIANNWQDYELLDSGDYQKLERFGSYTLVRPDPQIIWKKQLAKSIWDQADAVFERTKEDKGVWKFNKKLPEKWLMTYQDIKFWVKLSPFKHTGVFPEQASHWNFIKENLEQHCKDNPSYQPNILNLFGYTGISSLVAASAGAKVTHVDASYPAIGWARENQQASGLEEKPIRWIEDDVLKFCEREVRRGALYDGIIMDPPAYGHGPNGETWKFNSSFPRLLSICAKLITPKPLFIIINAYAISTSAITLNNILEDYFENLGGNVEFGELALEPTKEQAKKETPPRLLSTGLFARWSNQ